MNTIFNFGASHSLGWNCSTSYAQILAEKYNYKLDTHAMAGASLEYILLRIQLVADTITENDIVLVQLPGWIRFSLHVDTRKNSPANQSYRLFHYTSMTKLDQEPNSDFTYILKQYKSIMQNDEDCALHYYIQLHSIITLLKSLPCRVFAFFCVTPDQPKTTIFMLNQAYNIIKHPLIDPKRYVEFAESADIQDKYSVNKHGKQDTGHYSKHIHLMWANYIWDKINKD